MKELNYEFIMIELAIYLILGTSNENQITELSDCINILRAEYERTEHEETLFKVNKEGHIINKLYSNFSSIDEQEYKEIINNAILKIGYFNSVAREYHLMNVASEKDVDELTYEILNFNKGTDELGNKLEMNEFEEYELAERYYTANMKNEAYMHFEKSALKGHKKARYYKALCKYRGDGTEKDKTQAFKEITELLDIEVDNKAIALLGEMYYMGEGTDKDYNKAFECFKQVENEESIAQYYLGNMYLNGYGIEKDENIGIDYIIKSAKRRCKKAIDYIIELNYRYNNEQWEKK